MQIHIKQKLNNNIYKNLPTDILHIILSYDGRLIIVNGKCKLNMENEIYNDIKYSLSHKHFLLSNVYCIYNIYSKIDINLMNEETELRFFGRTLDKNKNNNNNIINNANYCYYFLILPFSRKYMFGRSIPVLGYL
jgi:hypothetical protein